MSKDDLRFVSLVGSSTVGSAVQAVANTLDELAPDDVEVRVLDHLVRLSRVGGFRGEDVPDEIAAFASRIAEANAVVVVSFDVRGPLSRLLENVFDWLRSARLRPLAGKPAAVITASAGPSGRSEPDGRLRSTLAALGAAVLDEPRVHVSGLDEKIDFDSACLRDAEARRLIASQLAALALLARAHRGQRSASG